jgi:GntR family transcriptional regulator, transcriptional repressor for pyruvate dehydrogenase complex
MIVLAPGRADVSAEAETMFQRSEKVPHSLARAIVRDVVEAQLPPGTILDPEAEMTVRYQVSRGSLREALRILEVLGFIAMKPGPKGGPMVLDADSSQFSGIATLYYQRFNATYEEILELRLTLERDAAYNAALRRTPDQIALLRAHLDHAAAEDVGDDKNFQVTGQDFHTLIAAIAGNRVGSLIIQSCYDVFDSRRDGYMYPPEQRAKVVRIHEQIAHAIIDGSPSVAHAMMNDHLQDYKTHASERYALLLGEVVKWE